MSRTDKINGGRLNAEKLSATTAKHVADMKNTLIDVKPNNNELKYWKFGSKVDVISATKPKEATLANTGALKNARHSDSHANVARQSDSQANVATTRIYSLMLTFGRTFTTYRCRTTVVDYRWK